jgi:hypothetical protein
MNMSVKPTGALRRARMIILPYSIQNINRQFSAEQDNCDILKYVDEYGKHKQKQ